MSRRSYVWFVLAVVAGVVFVLSAEASAPAERGDQVRAAIEMMGDK